MSILELRSPCATSFAQRRGWKSPKVKKLTLGSTKTGEPDQKEQKVTYPRTLLERLAFGAKCNTYSLPNTLQTWSNTHSLEFDVIMIGALDDQQFNYSLLKSLSLGKLLSKNGVMYIWASNNKISELNQLMKAESWNSVFRKCEEMIFVCSSPAIGSTTAARSSKASSSNVGMVKQWHCWICTGAESSRFKLTADRAGDDSFSKPEPYVKQENSPVSPLFASRTNIAPNEIYRVAENYPCGARKLHIVPMNSMRPIYTRPGWVVVNPNPTQNNFHPVHYRQLSESGEVAALGN